MLVSAKVTFIYKSLLDLNKIEFILQFGKPATRKTTINGGKNVFFYPLKQKMR